MNLGGSEITGSNVKFTQYGKGADSMIEAFIGNDGYKHSFSGKGVNVLSGEELKAAAARELNAGNIDKAKAMLASDTYFDGDITLSRGERGSSLTDDTSRTVREGNNYSIGNADIAALASGDRDVWLQYANTLLNGDGNFGVLVGDLNSFTGQNYARGSSKATEKAFSGFSFNKFGFDFQIGGEGVKRLEANTYTYAMGQLVGQLNQPGLTYEQKAETLIDFQRKWIWQGEEVNNNSAMENSLDSSGGTGAGAAKTIVDKSVSASDWVQEKIGNADKWMQDNIPNPGDLFVSGYEAGRNLMNKIIK